MKTRFISYLLMLETLKNIHGLCQIFNPLSVIMWFESGGQPFTAAQANFA